MSENQTPVQFGHGINDMPTPELKYQAASKWLDALESVLHEWAYKASAIQDGQA